MTAVHFIKYSCLFPIIVTALANDCLAQDCKIVDLLLKQASINERD